MLYITEYSAGLYAPKGGVEILGRWIIGGEDEDAVDN